MPLPIPAAFNCCGQAGSRPGVADHVEMIGMRGGLFLTLGISIGRPPSAVSIGGAAILAGRASISRSNRSRRTLSMGSLHLIQSRIHAGKVA